MAKTIYKNEELIALAKNGDKDAEEQLLVMNQKLCYHIAGKFLNTGIDKEDLASICKIGMIKAYKAYSPDKETKFASFASRVMSNEILMVLRKEKKHKATVNLENAISRDEEGNDLTFLDVVAAPEPNVSQDDIELIKYVLEEFRKTAKQREIYILEHYILGEDTQRTIGNALGISQSYVTRLITSIQKRLKNIAETGKDTKVVTKDMKKGDDTMSKFRKYKRQDYVYVFREYPNLTTKEIAEIMETSSQNVTNRRTAFNRGEYNNVELIDVSEKLIAKLLEYKPVEKIEEKNDIDLMVEELINEPEYIPNIPPFEEVLSTRIEELKKQDEYYEKEKEISNDEIIILNNHISITSDIEEVSQLIFGIYQLLNNSPGNSKVKLDLKFEVTT